MSCGIIIWTLIIAHDDAKSLRWILFFNWRTWHSCHVHYNKQTVSFHQVWKRYYCMRRSKQQNDIVVLKPSQAHVVRSDGCPQMSDWFPLHKKHGCEKDRRIQQNPSRNWKVSAEFFVHSNIFVVLVVSITSVWHFRCNFDQKADTPMGDIRTHCNIFRGGVFPLCWYLCQW